MFTTIASTAVIASNHPVRWLCMQKWLQKLQLTLPSNTNGSFRSHQLKLKSISMNTFCKIERGQPQRY